MRNRIRKLLKPLRNLIVWLTPFIFFIVAIFLGIYLLKGDFNDFKQLLEILVWPITVLLALFFFRKVVTYLFFSMDEFNFFGTKGELKNVNELINGEVQKRFLLEKEKQQHKEEIEKLARQLGNKSATAEENLKLARDIFKTYREYKKDTEKAINGLINDNKIFKETLFQSQFVEHQPSTISMEGLGLGTGEQIGDLQGKEPNK
jgi:hypothetical protein